MKKNLRSKTSFRISCKIQRLIDIPQILDKDVVEVKKKKKTPSFM